MTYLCNHRGGLSHSEIKHMGIKRKKYEREEARGKIEDIFMKMGKRVERAICFRLIARIMVDWLIYADFL